MHVGFTMDMRNPLGRPWRDHWEDCLHLMCEAEAMGFDYVMVQEHFFQPDGYAPSVPIFLTMLAERTSTIKIGSYVYILPLHHAAMLAQETAVLDHVSGGRLDVTVGSGHSAAEYQALGYSPKTRPSRMQEGLEVLKLAWTQRPFSYSGRYYELKDVTVAPAPLQQPHPPLWVAATAPPAARRAGRMGANLHGASVDPEFHQAYFDGLAEAGIARDQVRVSNPWAITVTDENPDAVWERRKNLIFERWDFYRRIRDEMGDPDLQYGLAPSPEAYRDYEIIGDADTVIGTLESLVKDLPLTDIVHSGPAGGTPPEEAYEDLKRFADRVLPTLKSW
ncbi:LLM class flavin-dependent oxidoreductase [Nonomuraea sp. NPDC048826]|uniref:LLM class flavin-dependent oxidoreductase n=1 Tax=Nonomuraea sp. NPDC048826 TaxID=3364347 RepID=UPI00371914D3